MQPLFVAMLISYSPRRSLFGQFSRGFPAAVFRPWIDTKYGFRLGPPNDGTCCAIDCSTAVSIVALRGNDSPVKTSCISPASRALFLHLAFTSGDGRRNHIGSLQREEQAEGASRLWLNSSCQALKASTISTG
jgi:hypothetical protein